MVTRRIGVSEARRLLPELVESVANEGGRVEITNRGEPRVTIVRTQDLVSAGDRAAPGAMRVEFSFPSGDLVAVVRELRERVGRPRPARRTRRKRKPRRATRK